MNTSFKQKIVAFTTSFCLTTSAFSATGLPLFDNLGSLLQGDTEAIAQNSGMVKGERQEGWFSPPPIIENLSKKGEKQMSDTSLWQPSVNYRSHPTLNTYRNGATYSGILDIHAPNIRLENSFFTEKNGTTEYLNLELYPVQIDDMKLKHINMDFVRAHDNGPSALSPMTISLTTTDKQGNELEPRAVFKVKKTEDKPGYYYKINEKNMANKTNGHAYLKIIYKYPHIDKEFFQTFLIDTFLFSKNQKKNILVEKISLVKENLRKPIPEDSVKRIKVYLSELTHMSPYYNDMVGYNDDVVLDDLTNPGKFTPIRMKEKTNVLNFLTHYPHTVLYKDNVLENYSKKYDSFDYAPYRGYWNKKGALVDKLVQERIFKTKNDGYITEKSLTLKTYTLGGANPGVKEELLEYEKTDNTMSSFMSNILEIPNYSQSMFINQWNQMNKSLGLKSGGIMLFEKDNKVTPVDFYQLYYQVQDKDVRNYKNVQYKDSDDFQGYQEYFETLRNVQKVNLSPKENLDLFEHVVKFQEDLYGEDNVISKNLYMLMSFEEYAATWGLTAAEAHKLFYFDDVGRMVWKYEGLKDYFAKKTFFDLSFIDFDKNELFSVGKINSEFKSKLPKGADQTKEVMDYFLKNADTLQKFYNTKLSDAEFIDLYNHKDNLFLAKKIQKLSERQIDNGKKLKKPFSSFYELFVYENCAENTLGYTQGVCASNDIWKKGRKPKPRLGLPINQPKDYIKVEKKNFNTDLYSGNFSRVHYAVKNGANVNAKNGLGMRPIEANIMAAVDERKGLIIEPTLFYYFLQKGSQLDQKFLDYFKKEVRTIEKIEGKTVFGLFTNTDTPAVSQIKKIHKNLTDIKNGTRTVEEVIEEEMQDVIQDEKMSWAKKGKILTMYFRFGMTDKNINELFKTLGTNVLHLASLNSDKEAIEDLITLGADVNKQSKFNTWLPIHFAANLGSKGVMKALIDAGADIDIRLSEKGATPINIAVVNGMLPQLKALVELGAKTNLKYYKNDNSLLAIAIEAGHIPIVDYLVKNGADTKYLNKNGTPVYKFAKKYKMKKYLREQLGFDF